MKFIDIEFKKYITPDILKGIYFFGMVCTILTMIVGIVALIETSNPINFIVLLLAPVGLLLLRISCECTIIIFNVADDLKAIRYYTSGGQDR